MGQKVAWRALLRETGLADLAENPVEVSHRCEVDRDLALACAEVHLHSGVETVAQTLSDLVEVPLAGSSVRLQLGRWLRGLARGGLCSAHGKIFIDDLVGEVLHGLWLNHREDRAGVAGRQYAGGNA